jgi:hypothetical protein
MPLVAQGTPDRMWLTKEGYVVYESDNLAHVQALCRMEGQSDEDAARVLGCAFWSAEKQPPNSPCFIIMWRGRAINNEAEMILDHELRHCREGRFHD